MTLGQIISDLIYNSDSVVQYENDLNRDTEINYRIEHRLSEEKEKLEKKFKDLIDPVLNDYEERTHKKVVNKGINTYRNEPAYKEEEEKTTYERCSGDIHHIDVIRMMRGIAAKDIPSYLFPYFITELSLGQADMDPYGNTKFTWKRENDACWQRFETSQLYSIYVMLINRINELA